jgi:hypothetical protein
MGDEFPGDNLKIVWQQQPIEVSTMTLEKIRKKARELHAKTRRQLLGTFTGPAVAVLCYAFSMKEFPGVQGLQQMLFMVALAWSLAGLYFLNRGKWSAAMPGDAGFSAGLEFCRREIERRRDYLGGVLLWSFGPVMLAVGTLILALAMVGSRERGMFPNGLPFLLLVVAWIVGWFVLRLREQRELTREIEELNDIARENGG